MGERFGGGYTGKLAESEVLGVSEFESGEKFEEYLRYTQAVDLAKEHQPFDPTDPEKPFPNDVHAKLAERLHLDNFSQLRYYTAIGSALDRFHGVDAFFELDLGDGKLVMVTIDITLNPHKDSYKADAILKWPPDGISSNDPEDKYLWQEKVEELVNLILEELQKKTNLEELHILTEEELENSKKISQAGRERNLNRLPCKEKILYA